LPSDILARNLLADQTCRNCQHFGINALKSGEKIAPGDYCSFGDLVKCPPEGTCEKWTERRTRSHLILGSAYSVKI
jgi:hypothetical protein